MELTAEMGRRLNKQKGQIYILTHTLTQVYVMCVTTEDRTPPPQGTGDQVGPSKKLTVKWTQEGSVTSYQVKRYAGD